MPCSAPSISYAVFPELARPYSIKKGETVKIRGMFKGDCTQVVQMVAIDPEGTPSTVAPPGRSGAPGSWHEVEHTPPTIGTWTYYTQVTWGTAGWGLPEGNLYEDGDRVELVVTFKYSDTPYVAFRDLGGGVREWWTGAVWSPDHRAAVQYGTEQKALDQAPSGAKVRPKSGTVSPPPTPGP